MLKFLGKLFIIIALITLGFIAGFFLLIERSKNLGDLSVGTALFGTVIIITFAVAVSLFIVGAILFRIGRRLGKSKAAPKPAEAGRTSTSKILRCRDIGMDCDFVVHGKDEKEVLNNAKAHAKSHGFTEKDLTPQFMERLRKAIKNE